MHGNGWQGVLLQTLIVAAVEALRQTLSEFKDRVDDPTLPQKDITAHEAVVLIHQSELLISRLKQHPELVKAPELLRP